MERIEWAFTIKNKLVFRNVEFMDEVVLDDCIFERSIEFRGCRFMRGLSLHNATVKGSLILDRSQIEGAIEKAEVSLQEKSQQPVKNSLDIRGLRVDRLLSFDRLTVYGQLDGKGLRAGNAVHGRGLQVSLREKIDDSYRPALDFSHASISGPLLLDAHDDYKSSPLNRFRRTIVSGAVSFEGLSAQEVKLEGMVVGGNLDCQFSNISGGIWLRPFDRRVINWRTFVNGWLNLYHARVGVLYFDGCHIERSILMVEMHARSIYARGYSPSRPDGKDSSKSGLYRSKIGGDFQASGAVIENVIEVEGAWVDGELLFITGRCGRLSLTVHPWWEDEGTPRLTPCEAHGLALFNFTIDRSVYCVGLRLTSEGSHPTWSKGGVLTHDLRIGGSLLFWHSEQSKRLKQKLGMPPNGNTVAIEDAIAKSIAKVRAKVPGIMELEGAHIEGTVNLSRTKIDGSINLTNANVGDSLLICDDESDLQILRCTGLIARNMQVGGDADLRGLKVKASVNLQDVEVDGILQLATADAKDFEPAVSVEEGSIDLSGAHASQIVLSGKSLTSTDEKHGFMLDRCKVGQLTICGFYEVEPGFFKELIDSTHDKIFKKPRNKTLAFPRKINLTAIEVGDWGVAAESEAAALLKASVPFDARVYLDLENRLSRQGYTHRANDVYRAMAKRTRKNLWSCGVRGWLIALGSIFNLAFSGNGTLLSPMVSLLIISIIFTACLLSFPANIESIDKNPPYTPEFLAKNWGVKKAFGLAWGYAIPIYKPAPDIAKARLVGPTCFENAVDSSETKSSGKSMEGQAPRGEEIWVFELKRIEIPLVLLNNSYQRTQFETISNSIDVPTSVTECKPNLSWPPHDIVQAVSFLQLLLWIFLAGNLPTIMRKRG